MTRRPTRPRGQGVGYSGKPLAAKLGIRPGSGVHTVGAPSDYRRLLAPLPAGVTIEARLTGTTSMVHLFSTRRQDLLENLTAFRATLKPDAVVWVSWPKKASKVPTDITEDRLRDLLLPAGWVDTKVCAIDATWSGLCFMRRRSKGDVL